MGKKDKTWTPPILEQIEPGQKGIFTTQDNNTKQIERGHKATISDYKGAKPLPVKRRKLTINISFTQKEYERMKYGFVPGDNDDRWFIYEENDIFYFHRFVTGNCIFVVKFQKQDNVHIPVEILASDEDGPKDDEKSKQSLIDAINYRLLGKTE